MSDALLGTFRVKVVHGDNERSECLSLTVLDKRRVERGECSSYQIIYEKLLVTPSRAFVTRDIAVFVNDITSRKLSPTDTPQRDVLYFLYNCPDDRTSFPPGHVSGHYERVELVTPTAAQAGFTVGEEWRGTIDFGPLGAAICAPTYLWDGEAVAFVGTALCSAGDLPEGWLPPSGLDSPLEQEIRIASERDFYELAHENYYGAWRADRSREVFSERWISPELGERARIPQLLLTANDPNSATPPRDAAHAWLEVSESQAPLIELLSEQHILPYFDSASHPKLRVILQPVHALTTETLEALRAPPRAGPCLAGAAAPPAQASTPRLDGQGAEGDAGAGGAPEGVAPSASSAGNGEAAPGGWSEDAAGGWDDGGQLGDGAAADAPRQGSALPGTGNASAVGPADDRSVDHNAKQVPGTPALPPDASSQGAGCSAKRVKMIPTSNGRKRAPPPQPDAPGSGPSDSPEHSTGTVAASGANSSTRQPGAPHERGASPSKKRARKGRHAAGHRPTNVSTTSPGTPSETTLGEWLGSASTATGRPSGAVSFTPMTHAARPALRLHVAPGTSRAERSVGNVKREPTGSPTAAAFAEAQRREERVVIVLSDSESDDCGAAAPDRLRGSGPSVEDEPRRVGGCALDLRAGRPRTADSGGFATSAAQGGATAAPAIDALDTPLRVRGAGGNGAPSNGKPPTRDDGENGAARRRKLPCREVPGAARAMDQRARNGNPRKGAGSPGTKQASRAPHGAHKRPKPTKQASAIGVNPLSMATITVPQTAGELEPGSDGEEPVGLTDSASCFPPLQAFRSGQGLPSATAPPEDRWNAGGQREMTSGRPPVKGGAQKGAAQPRGLQAGASSGTTIDAVYRRATTNAPDQEVQAPRTLLMPVPSSDGHLLQSPLYPKRPSSRLHHGFLLHLQAMAAGQSPSDRQFQGFLARASTNPPDSAALHRSSSEMLSPIDSTPLRVSPLAGASSAPDSMRTGNGGEGQPGCRPAAHAHSGNTRLVAQVDIDDTLVKTFRIHPATAEALARLEAYFANADWRLKAQEKRRKRHRLMVLSHELARILDELSTSYSVSTGRKLPGSRSEEGERMPWLPVVHGKLVAEGKAFVIRVESERVYSWTNQEKTTLGWVEAAPWYGLVIPRRDVQLVPLATFQRYHVMFQSNSTPEYVNTVLSALHEWMEEACTKQPLDSTRDAPSRSFRHCLDLLKKSERRPNQRSATPGGLFASFGRERVWDWYKNAEVEEWRTLKVIREFFSGARISTRYHYTLGPRLAPRCQGGEVNKSAAKGLLFGNEWERVRMFVVMVDDNINAWTPQERPLVVYIKDIKPVECGFTLELFSERKDEASWLKNMTTWFQGLSDPSHGFELDLTSTQISGQAKKRSGLLEFAVVRLWHVWIRAVILGLDRGLDSLLADETRLHMETLIVWDRLASAVPKLEAANPAA